MYWVFDKDQVQKATKAFVDRTCQTDAEKNTAANLIANFLTSPEAQNIGMVKGEIKK